MTEVIPLLFFYVKTFKNLARQFFPSERDSSKIEESERFVEIFWEKIMITASLHWQSLVDKNNKEYNTC